MNDDQYLEMVESLLNKFGTRREHGNKTITKVVVGETSIIFTGSPYSKSARRLLGVLRCEECGFNYLEHTQVEGSDDVLCPDPDDDHPRP